MRNGYWKNPCTQCTEAEVDAEMIRLLGRRWNLPQFVLDELYCRKCQWTQISPEDQQELFSRGVEMMKALSSRNASGPGPIHGDHKD